MSDFFNNDYENNFEFVDLPDRDMNSRKRRRNPKMLMAGFLAAVFIVSVVGFGSFALKDYLAQYINSDNGGSISEQADSTNGGTGGNISLELASKPSNESVKPDETGRYNTEGVAELVKPSVVGVVTYQQAPILQELGAGSGIIMTADGYIITNEHVVSGANAVKVVLSDNKEYEAEIVGSDVKTDLAVLKINAKGLTPAAFGSSSQTKVGEDVVAIGNPAGLSGSVTKGIVSELNREVATESGYGLKSIQTDAAINPGNSGGALVNMFGQVIGINSSKYVGTGYEGIGFAIAIDEAKPILDHLINYGYVKDRVKIGISYTEITETTARMYGLKAGLYVQAIDEEAQVASSGLKEYDIITHIDGVNMTSASLISSVLEGKKPGDKLELTVYRKSIT
ncbi:MAG: trypsin-like serine protease, partial [Clostridiales bacterium]|nr:trypsin-like serine protease [Clostridiales bacterium]